MTRMQWAVVVGLLFFILVIFYSGVTMAVSLAGWLQKMWIQRKAIPGSEALKAIELRTDRIKAQAFPIAVVLVLFCITPFVVIIFLMPR